MVSYTRTPYTKWRKQVIRNKNIGKPKITITMLGNDGAAGATVDTGGTTTTTTSAITTTTTTTTISKS
jgi:hypothetical protein